MQPNGNQGISMVPSSEELAFLIYDHHIDVTFQVLLGHDRRACRSCVEQPVPISRASVVEDDLEVADPCLVAARSRP